MGGKSHRPSGREDRRKDSVLERQKAEVNANVGETEKRLGWTSGSRRDGKCVVGGGKQDRFPSAA